MNKKVLIPTLALSFALPVQAFASEVESNQEPKTEIVEAGLTPDDFMYPIDQLGESIGLQLADEGVEKATTLDVIAEERVSEVAEMIEQGNTELVAPTLEDYQATLDELNNELDTAIENGEDVTEVIVAMEEKSEIEEALIEEAIETLPESEQESISEVIKEMEEQLDETTETVDIVEVTDEAEGDSLKKQVATSVLVAKIGEEALKQSQENQLNERQILAIQSIADKSGKSFDEVLTVFLKNEKGIGSTTKDLGLKPNEVMKTVNHDFKEAKKQIQKQFKETKKGSPAVQKESVEQESIVDSDKSMIQETVEEPVQTPVQTPVQKKEEVKVKPSKQPESKQHSVTHEEKSKGKSEEKKQEKQSNANKKVEEKAVNKPHNQEVKHEKKEEPKKIESKVTAPSQVTVPKVEEEAEVKAQMPKAETNPQPSKEKEQGNNGGGKGNGNGKGNGQEKGNGHNES
ncbi:hypothetical protein CVD28_01375 [Bacillus sp. M6-12]|uniref:DUF5667 domain-containing protein n=1 Tax=Bacillus sp. M6-12 TaxID=2054166 RepID=UPI000C792392|nr:DUF5667 domain-containing protein [Bacillus sp. M6-12]PLS19085.1 hypothetical protein CVD28_01375 [Bacillus sp. M6-12]